MNIDHEIEHPRVLANAADLTTPSAAQTGKAQNVISNKPLTDEAEQSVVLASTYSVILSTSMLELFL